MGRSARFVDYEALTANIFKVTCHLEQMFVASLRCNEHQRATYFRLFQALLKYIKVLVDEKDIGLVFGTADSGFPPVHHICCQDIREQHLASMLDVEAEEVNPGLRES